MSLSKPINEVTRLSLKIKPITYVQIGTLTAAQWKSFAVKISTPYTRGGNIENTPYDPRLGVLDNGKEVCRTCGGYNSSCPGHFGYIELEKPVFNKKFFNVLLPLLNSVCNSCSKPRIKPENTSWMGLLAYKRHARIKNFKNKCKNVLQCPYCDNPLPFFYFDNKKGKMKMSLGQDATSKTKSITISASEVYKILIQISDETVELLGLNYGLSTNVPLVTVEGKKVHPHRVRPESFIFEVFPVIPIPARPWIMRDGERRDDDLTEKYNTILKLNEKLRIDREYSLRGPTDQQPINKSKRKGGKLKEVEKNKIEGALQYHIWTLINNSDEKAKASTGGRVHKGIEERLKGKEGHVLGNSATKRSDFSARTVITGGGEIVPVGTVGCPEVIAEKESYPEMVVWYNKAYLERLLAMGQINTVTRNGIIFEVATTTKNGTRPFEIDKETGLKMYDMVERKMQDYDWVLFNRQPTLVSSLLFQ